MAPRRAASLLLPLLLLLPSCGEKGGPAGGPPPAAPPAASPAGATPGPSAPPPGRVGGEALVPVPPPPGGAPAGAPRVTALRFVPDPSRPSAGLGVEPSGEGPRGKGVEYEIEWARNGEPAGKGRFLPVAARRGDTVRVTVRPYDADGYGVPVTVEREVRNAPPVAGSPVEVSFDGATWTGRVPAEDADGDPLSFRLKEGPPGMAVDGAGRLRWPVPAGFAGTASATVVVSDGAGGESEGTFRVTVRND